MSNRHPQLAPVFPPLADRAAAQFSRLPLGIIVIIMSLSVAVAIRLAPLADWAT
jgi:hypothetical protein